MCAILCMLLLWQTCVPHCMPRPIGLPYFTSSLCWQTCASLCMPHPMSNQSAVFRFVASLTDIHAPLHAPSDRSADLTSSLLWQTCAPLCMLRQIGSAIFHFVAPLIGVHAIYMFLLLTCTFSHYHETLTLPLLCPNGSCACTRHDTNLPWYKLKASCCKEGIPKRFCNNDTMVWIFLRCKTETQKLVCSASKVTTCS